MDISIEELRAAANLLLDYLVREGYQQVSLSHDYYWSVPKEAAFDPYHQPTSLTLGQLTEDMNELRRLLRGDTEPLAYGLVWLAAVLRAVGEEVVA